MNGYEGACCRQGCHGRVCLSAEVYQRARRTHETFWCSAGHGQHFTGESDEERTIRELREQLHLRDLNVRWRDERIEGLKERLLDCRWNGCEFHATNDKGLGTHMRAAHGMPSLGQVRSEAS